MQLPSTRRPVLIAALLAMVAQFLTVSGGQKQDPARLLTHAEVNILPSKEKRWALIIGIDKYDDENITALRGGTNDAKALARALKDYAGFNESQIIVLTNEQPRSRQPTRLNILRYLSNLKGSVPKDGLLLVSFSGHGIERDRRAFLIPSDAVFTEDIKLLQQTAVSADEMRQDIQAIGVRHVLILVDACRNDPVSGKADSVNPLTEAYLRAFDFDTRNQEVTAFATLYATEIGSRAYENTITKQGYFTGALVEGLSGKAADRQTGEVTLRNLVKYLETEVPKQVAINLGGSKIQKPFAVIEGYRADELVLAVARSLDSSTRDVLSGERAFWKEVEKRDSQEAYEAFLKAYPSGEYAQLATFKLTNLKKQLVEASEYYERGIASGFSDHTQAITNFTKAIELNPRYEDAFVRRSIAYERLREYDRALADLNRALELNANNVDAYHLRGVIYEYKNELDRAIADFTRAIQLKPTHSSAFYNRGRLQKKIGKIELAIADYTKAISNGDSPFSLAHFYNARGRAYLDQDDYARVLPDLNKAIELNPNEHEFYSSRGDYFFARKEFQKAINDYTQALTRGADGSSDDYYRGIYHRKRADAYHALRDEKEAGIDSEEADRLQGVRQNSVGMKFLYIPAGTFLMGSTQEEVARAFATAKRYISNVTPAWFVRETPQRRVNFARGFWLGKYEVTKDEWDSIMKGTRISDIQNGRLPVTNVSWDEVQEFIRKLNEKDREYSYRLPTEAEWEYAARAGRTDSDCTRVREEASRNDTNSNEVPHPVESTRANAFGLHDMYGNVTEWVQDIFADSYSNLPTDGSANTTNGNKDFRVLRGNSYRNTLPYCRVTERSYVNSHAKLDSFGVRLVAIPK